MNKKTGIIVGGIIVIVALLFAARSAYVKNGATTIGKTEATINTSGTNTVSGVTYNYATSTAPTSRAMLPKGIPVPNLDKAVVIPAHFLPDIAAKAKERIAKLTSGLRENPANAALWAELGLERKGIEDYSGSREAYEYAYALVPQNPVISDNLGVLYGYYLHDPKKAEMYFKKALALDPQTAYRYLRLYELYHDILKDKAKTKAILEQGLRTIPGNASFTALLEEFKQ